MKITDQKALPFGKVSLPTLKLLDGYGITLAGLKVLIYLDSRSKYKEWGFNATDVSKMTHLHIKTVHDWLKFFKEQGVLTSVPPSLYNQFWNSAMTYYALDLVQYTKLYWNADIALPEKDNAEQARSSESITANPNSRESGDSLESHNLIQGSGAVDSLVRESADSLNGKIQGVYGLPIEEVTEKESEKEENIERRQPLEAASSSDGLFVSSSFSSIDPSQLLGYDGLDLPYAQKLEAHKTRVLNRITLKGLLPRYMTASPTDKGTIIKDVVDGLIREGAIEPFEKRNANAKSGPPPRLAPSVIDAMLRAYAVPELPPECGRVVVVPARGFQPTPTKALQYQPAVPPSAKTIVSAEQIIAFLRGKCDPSVPDEPPQNDAKGGETPPVRANPTGNPPPTPQDGTALPPQ